MSYSLYLKCGGTIEELNKLAENDDWRFRVTPSFQLGGKKPEWDIGDIYRLVTNRAHAPNSGAFIRVRTLKVGLKEYRFADTIEELEHLAMLHGIHKKDPIG